MIETPIEPAFLHGATWTEHVGRGLRVHRLPAWARAEFPDPLLMSMESQPSGVRLVVRTRARTIELVTHPTRLAYRGLDRARGRIDVFADNQFVVSDELVGGDLIEIDPATGDSQHRAGPTHVTRIDLPDGAARVEMWLPHNETCDLIALRSDAPVEAVVDRRPRWVHHGSSISQGSNALAPSDIWPAVAARAADVNLLNLGFGGSAQVDQFLARVIRDLPADLISVKLGINVVNADAMRLRAFVPALHGFLDTIRDGHPDTPLLLVSPIFCGVHEHTPGPGAFDPEALATGRVRFAATGDPDDVRAGRLTLAVVRREMASLVDRRSHDGNLHYLDGTRLFGPADEIELPLPDALHPGPEAHRRIGERFAAHAFAHGGPFPVAAPSSELPVPLV